MAQVSDEGWSWSRGGFVTLQAASIKNASRRTELASDDLAKVQSTLRFLPKLIVSTFLLLFFGSSFLSQQSQLRPNHVDPWKRPDSVRNEKLQKQRRSWLDGCRIFLLWNLR